MAILQSFIEHIPFAVAMFDCDMRYLAVSKRWMTDFRLGARSFLGKSHYTVFPEISDAWKSVHRRCLAGAMERNDGEAFPRADGSIDWVRWEVIPWHLADGRIGGVIIFSEDITERKRSEQALRQSEERLRVTLTSIGDAVITTDTTGHVTFLNPVAESLTGWSQQDAVGQPIRQVFSIINEQTREQADDIVGRVLRENTIVALANHTALVRRDGRKIAIEDSAAPITDAEGHIIGVVLVFHDVTERRRIQEALRIAEGKFAKAFAANPAALSLTRMSDGKITEVNETWLATFGYRRDEVIERTAHDLQIWATNEERMRGVRELQDKGSLRNVEFTMQRKSGEMFVALGSVELLTIAGESMSLSTWVDVTDRKLAEQKLRESEARQRRFYDSGLLGVIYWNMDGVIEEANDKFLEMVGYTREDLVAGHIDWVNLTPPEYRYLDERSVAELQTTGVNAQPFEKEYLRKDGTRIPILIAGAMLDEERFHGVAFVLDITERKQAEQEIVQANERFHLLMHAMPVGVAVAENPACHVITLNPAGAQLFGVGEVDNVSASAPEGDRRQNRYFIGGREVTPEELPMQMAVLQDREVRRAEVEGVMANGRRWVALCDAVPLHDAVGKVTGGITTFTDITELKRVEEALRESEMRLRIALGAARLGIHDYDVTTSAVQWDARVREPGASSRSYRFSTTCSCPGCILMIANRRKQRWITHSTLWGPASIMPSIASSTAGIGSSGGWPPPVMSSSRTDAPYGSLEQYKIFPHENRMKRNVSVY